MRWSKVLLVAASLSTAAFSQVIANPADPSPAVRSATPAVSSEMADPPAVAPVVAVVRPDPHRISQQCRGGEIPRHYCKLHLAKATVEGVEFVTFLGAATLWPEGRRDGVHGKFLDQWLQSASNFRFTRWSQDSPRLDTWIGHPYMGAITNYIWYGNDAMSKTMQWDDGKAYWKSRLRAVPWTLFWQFEWKLGPIGDASIGNYGYAYWYNPEIGKFTNDTGMAPIVNGAVLGLGWTIGEDVLDRYAIRRLENKSRNPVYLLFVSMLNPAHSSANLFRFRAPWYRDDRDVKANWSLHSAPKPRIAKR